jgi:hypothetical protein
MYSTFDIAYALEETESSLPNNIAKTISLNENSKAMFINLVQCLWKSVRSFVHNILVIGNPDIMLHILENWT